MATKTFHPTSDISLGHSLNTGSSGWNLLGTNDADSTYISGTCDSASTVSATSSFGFSGSFGTSVLIKSVTAYIVGRTTSSSSSDTKEYSLNLSINGVAGTAQTGALSDSYTTYSKKYTQGLNTTVVSDISQLNLNLTITSSGKKAKNKDSNFNNYFTEAYIIVEYDEISAHTVSAVAKTGIVSASANPTLVQSGNNATFTAQVQNYYTFLGWYSDSNGQNLVSPAGANPYTTAVTSSLTLYAFATINRYNAVIGAQPSNGSATVSATTNDYNANVTFTATVTDSSKEFWGWYSDAAHTQLVSEANPYTTNQPASTLTLYPYIGDKRYYLDILCSHVMDVKPFRFNGGGTYNNGDNGGSRSLITNQSILRSQTSVNSSIYATQNHYKYDSNFDFGMSFHFSEGAKNLPSNATVVGVTGHIGLATLSGSSYSNMSLYAGEMEWLDYHNTALDQPDETAITSRRGNSRSITINAAPTDYVLTPVQMGAWTANEIRNGRCGIELDFTHSGDQTGINVYLAKITVAYTYNYTTRTCKAQSTGHCDTYVMDSASANPKYYESELQVTNGNSCTWFAQPEPGYRFDGWYSDSACTNLVSSDAVYTVAVTESRTLYAKTHYHSRVIAKTLEVPFGQGKNYYQGYYSDNGNSWTATNTGSNGFQTDMDLTTGIYQFVNITVKASIGCTNGKPYVKALLNNAAKDILFPNDTAHPVKMDWYNEAGRGSATILLNIVARNPMTINETVRPIITTNQTTTELATQRPSLIGGVAATQTGMRDSAILGMTKSSDIGYIMTMTNASRSKAIGVNNSVYTLYFEEYDFSAQIHQAARGVEAVAVSRAIGYEGDSVTFTATLLPGVTFDGWYDANGIRVSTDVTYTCVPNANLTLYAKAITDLDVYSVSTNAASHVKTATCDHIIMTAGNPVTFTATVDDIGWELDGWYLNGEPVSSENPYTRIITEDTALEARAKQTIYTIAVQQANSGIAKADPPSGVYNSTTQLSWTSNNEWYEFQKWQLLQYAGLPLTDADIYSTAPVSLTAYGTFEAPERYYNLRDRDTWSGATVFPSGAATCDVLFDGVIFKDVPILDCNYKRYNIVGELTGTYTKVIGGKNNDYPFAFYSTQNALQYLALASDDNTKEHTFGLFFTKRFTELSGVDLATQNPYTYTITGNAQIKAVVKDVPKITLNVVADTGITSTSVSKSPAKSGDSVVFSATVNEDYIFDGWYTSASSTTPESRANPYTKVIDSYSQPTTVTLYAKSVYNRVHFSAAPSSEGTSTVSISKSVKGQPVEVTFSFEPTNGLTEDYGWFYDAEHTLVASYENVFTNTFDGTSDVILYPGSVLTPVFAVAENTTEAPIANRLWGYLIDDSIVDLDNLTYDFVAAAYSGDPSGLPAGTYSRFTEVSNDGTTPLLLTIPVNPQTDAKKILVLFGQSVQGDKTIVANMQIRSSSGETTYTYPDNGYGQMYIVRENTVEYLMDKAQESNGDPYFNWVVVDKCNFSAESDTGAQVWVPSEAEQGYRIPFFVWVKPGYELVGVYSDEDSEMELTGEGNKYFAEAPSSEDGLPTSITVYIKTIRISNGVLTVSIASQNIIIDTEIDTSTNVIYDGRTITTISLGDAVVLNCKNCIAASDIIIGNHVLSCKDKILLDNITVQINDD